ncbi:hypothetical protein [Streptomyces sp. CMB-StM0423]|uniref:hypothetical protein n=1 Tax=Streptomyces sp. CMB-StM0423 TaxID=2059884 RepID=UPI001F1BC654|nr:hypothetical protein [Streptomyces sp. CMB-StM0423]
MTDSYKTTVLAGVAGGYLLGRTRKAKLALTLAALVAGRRLAPQDLLGMGARRIADTPQLAAASGQATDQMMTAAREAIGSLVDRRVTSLTDSLRERTDRLGELGEEREARHARAGQDEDDEGRDRHTAASKRRPPARRKTAGSARPTASGPRQKAAAGAERGSRGTAKSTRTKAADRPSRRQRS